MTDCTDDCDLARLCSQRHWSIYWILILCSTIFVCGRILSIGFGEGESRTPFMGANDLSRWATVQSLGDHKQYEIDDVILGPGPIYRDTIDKVQHLGRDGQPHFYSSKPVLLPTTLSWLYRAVKVATGLNLTDSPVPTVRLILLIFNGGCWVLFLWLLASTLERIETRDWTRYFIVATAGFATYLSTFAVALNNHLPAATAAMLVVFCLVHIVNRQGAIGWYALAGLASGLVAANELPALSLAGMAGGACITKSPRNFLLGFVPGFTLVAVAFFAANYAAHDDWRPPYAHRGDGKLLAKLEGDFELSLNEGVVPEEISGAVDDAGLSAIKSVEPANWPNRNGRTIQRWIVTDFEDRRITIVKLEDSSVTQIHAWDNWYDFEGSYWTAKNNGEIRSEIDNGQPDTALYSFHMLFGHHGILSLTPIWLLGFGGMVALLFRPRLKLRWLAGISIIVTVVVLAFYVFGVSSMDRNYGGQTSAFRWAFWLSPLWLIAMVPVVEWLSMRTSGRTVCLILLGISAISALYASADPWIHPWLYEIWEITGLPK